jgi:CMP-N-acetylneuraminic acid synthetase
MTVTKIQKFLWNDSEPLNYNRAEEKWPRTQTISPVWEVNSGAFIASREIYEMYEDRIGSKPYLLEIDENASFDIDWMSDFEIAEAFYSRSRSNRISNSTPRILN